MKKKKKPEGSKDIEEKSKIKSEGGNGSKAVATMSEKITKGTNQESESANVNQGKVSTAAANKKSTSLTIREPNDN